MHSEFLKDVFAGYEVMRIANRNGWKLIRVIHGAKGTRVMYIAS